MTAKPKYFTLQEFLTSSTARQRSIENLPSFKIVEHLRELGLFLDGLREAWGSGVNVSSGFRNKALNSAVGGVDNSVHKIGYAADITPANGKMTEFKTFVKNWLKDKNFDQAIIERNRKGQEWIHIALFGNSGQQRRSVFNLTVK